MSRGRGQGPGEGGGVPRWEGAAGRQVRCFRAGGQDGWDLGFRIGTARAHLTWLCLEGEVDKTPQQVGCVERGDEDDPEGLDR